MDLENRNIIKVFHRAMTKEEAAVSLIELRNEDLEYRQKLLDKTGSPPPYDYEEWLRVELENLTYLSENGPLEMPNSPEKFLSMVLDSYPLDRATLRKIISLGRIEYSRSSYMTACVKGGRPFTLSFGKKFIGERLRTVEDCVFILAHELTHLVLDHFAEDIIGQFKDAELRMAVVNIILDCQVNSTCYHTFKKQPKYFEFTERYYSPTLMPYCLLRPNSTPPPQYLEIYQKIWSEDGATNQEIIDALKSYFEQERDELVKNAVDKLLGGHSNGGEGDEDSLSEISEAVMNDIKDALDKNNRGGEEKANENRSRKAGSDSPRKANVTLREAQLQYVNRLTSRLKKRYVVSASSKIYNTLQSFNPKRCSRTVIPNFYDRNTVAMYSMGKLPVFHKNRTQDSKVIVPIYVDVSGSQGHVIEKVIPTVVRLKSLIGNVVYCFSTDIQEVTIDQLKRGEIHSGGTCFNCVARHILKNKFRNALILTDGEATMDEDLFLNLKRSGVKIKVGWTVSSPQQEPLSSLAAETINIPFDVG